MSVATLGYGSGTTPALYGFAGVDTAATAVAAAAFGAIAEAVVAAPAVTADAATAFGAEAETVALPSVTAVPAAASAFTGSAAAATEAGVVPSATYVGDFGTVTADVVKRGAAGTDRHNNPTLGELRIIRLECCSLQQRNTDETLDQRESTETTWILFAPAPTGIDLIVTTDLIRVDAATAWLEPDAGQSYATFKIDGNPDYLPHVPDGSAHHLELILSRVRL